MNHRFKKFLGWFFGWRNGLLSPLRLEIQETETVRYFVAYNFTCGRYLNGVRTPGCGMSMVEVPGGIRSWEQILAIREHLVRRCEDQDHLPSPQVTITNLIEIHRCKTPKPMCPRGR